MIKHIFLFLFLFQFGFSQISFQLEILLQDTLQDGQYPSAVVDTNGNLRFIYYNAYQDKLLRGTYFVSSDSVGKLLPVNPDLQAGYGYPAKLFINSQGKIFCAYMQNVAGRMSPWLAEQLPDGSWKNERLTNTTYGQYGTTYRYQPLWTQASIDLFVDSSETRKLAAFFSGSFDLATFSYDMKLYLASYDGTNWNITKTPNMSVWNPANPIAIQQEGINGERLGEFCNIIRDSTDKFSVFCSGSINGNLVKTYGNYGNPAQWQYEFIDSVLGIVPTLSDEQRRNACFQGVDAVKKDSLTHLVYAVGTRTGSPTTVPASLFSVSYKKFLKDSLVLSSYIVSPGTNDFVLHPEILPYSQDTLLATYANLSRKKYYFAFSTDSGKTWTKYPIYSTRFPDQKTALLLRDSLIFVLLYDNEKQALVLLKKNLNSLSDTLWQSKILTRTRLYGNEIASDFLMQNNTEKYLATFTENISGGIFLKTNSRFSSFDLPDKQYYSPAVLALDTANYYISYTDGTTNLLKLASALNGNLPNIEVVDFSTNGFAPSLVYRNGSLYIAFASSDGIRLANKTGASWNYEIIDSSGIYPRLFLYQNSLHCLYYSWDSSAIFLAKKQAGNWQKTRISDSLVSPTPDAYDVYVLGDTLHIAFRSDQNKVYYVSLQNGVPRSFLLNLPEQAILATRLRIVADNRQRPWIIYSVQDDQARLGLGFFNDSTWYAVNLLHPVLPPFSAKILDDKLHIIAKYKQDSISALAWLVSDSLSNYFSGTYSGLEFTENLPEICLYPNPAKDHIFLQAPETSHLKLYNLAGKSLNFSCQNGRIDFDLPPGIYFLSGKTAEGIYWTKKFIVR